MRCSDLGLSASPSAGSEDILTKPRRFTKEDDIAVKTIRVLAADTVQKANSGHPGAPIGMAPVAHVLFTRLMNMNPANPNWFNRDRFVLSNGHGCALQYCMLHLCGYKVSMNDLKSFRQVGSITPGHPENFMTDGIEVSTGPLGQGIAQAVGLAIASKHMAARYNKPGFPVIDHKVWVFCGDGCLQEGVSGEASSLAGHLKLNNMVLVYDDNNITIDGNTSLSFTEDVAARYRSYGWEVITVTDGNENLDAMMNAMSLARASTKPVIICLKTIIGYKTTKENTHGVHGSPLGAESLAAFKKTMGFDADATFVVPQTVRDLYSKMVAGPGRESEAAWMSMMNRYAEQFPSEAKEFWRVVNRELPEGWDAKLPSFSPSDKPVATRNIGGSVLNAIAPIMPELIGGSADLTPSNKTQLKCSGDFQAATPEGRYLRFGVREHAMFAIGNGISAYGLVPFTATFLNFITYGWGAVRLGALSHLQHIYVMTHDSVWLGEDGPTHQPIEVLPLLRATPNLECWRPCDGREVVAAWKAGITNRTKQTVICLSRQKLPCLEGSSEDGANKGGYAVVSAASPQVVLVGSGSEVATCVEAAGELKNRGVSATVVSMPVVERFEQQSGEYRRSVLPPGVPVVAVEASSSVGWSAYSHFQVCIDRFGASGPLKSLQEYFGFTGAKVADSVQGFLSGMDKSGAVMTRANVSILKAQL